MLYSRCDELPEERVGTLQARLELRVELAADHPGVLPHLGDLHQPLVGRESAEDQPGLSEQIAIGVVKLKAVAVALCHDAGRVGLSGFGPGF